MLAFLLLRAGPSYSSGLIPHPCHLPSPAQCSLALVLGAVSVNGRGGQVVAAEELLKPVGSALGLDKHHSEALCEGGKGTLA